MPGPSAARIRQPPYGIVVLLEEFHLTIQADSESPISAGPGVKEANKVFLFRLPTRTMPSHADGPCLSPPAPCRYVATMNLRVAPRSEDPHS